MDKYYVECQNPECKKRAYAIPDEPKWYSCPDCEELFESDATPLIERGTGIVEPVPSQPEPPGQEPEKTKKEGSKPMPKMGICPGCKKEKKIVSKGLCGYCYTKQRVANKKNTETKSTAAKAKKLGVKVPFTKQACKPDQCQSCIHKDVCGLTPSCEHYIKG